MDEQYMLIIVGAVVTSYGLVSALRLKRSAAWPRVEGRVVRSEKRVEHTDAGRLEDADIAYEYAFGGRVYTSRVVKVGGDMLTSPSKRPPSGADLLLAKYPVGRVVDVYVDPQHPKVACLERAGGEAVLLSTLCGAAAVAAGIYFAEIKAFLGKVIGGLWG
jgi:hypothetical protein